MATRTAAINKAKENARKNDRDYVVVNGGAADGGYFTMSYAAWANSTVPSYDIRVVYENGKYRIETDR